MHWWTSVTSSSTSTIIEYSRIFYMNLDNSWVNDHGSSLREEEENVDNLFCDIFTVYRGISRIRLWRFEQPWNKDESSSSVHRESVVFMIRVQPSSSGGSNPMSVHPRTKSNYRKEDRTWTMIPGWHTWRRHFSKRSFSSTSASTSWKKAQWRSERKVLGGYTTSIEDKGVYKITSLTGKRIHVWGLGLHCLYCGSFKSVNWAIFVQSEVHKRIIPPRMMNYAKIHYKSKIHEEDGKCTISFDNNASEAEVITDKKKSRKMNHQIHWRPEQNAKYWIYSSVTQKRILADEV